ncbi:SDR family NAD(P)-dependent oxidoreductase [Arthrobacter sp. TMN-49]
MPSLKGALVLVTGASGGIGTHFVHQALARGAARVYASARNPRAWDDERIVPLTLDVTDSASIQAAVEGAGDVTVLTSNAGASTPTPGILSHTDDEIRANVETNFLGPRIRTDPLGQDRSCNHRYPLGAELVCRGWDIQCHEGGPVVGNELPALGASAGRRSRGGSPRCQRPFESSAAELSAPLPFAETPTQT